MSDLAIPHWLRGLECKLEEIASLLNSVETPEWAKRLEWKINQIIDLEGVIISDQEHLDADVAALSAAFTTIIADLKAQPQAAALDFTAADALVASVTAAVPASTDASSTDTSSTGTSSTDTTTPSTDAAAPVSDTSVATA